MTDAQLAERMFNAYNEEGPNPWKTFDGRPVPRWNEINDAVRLKWTAAAFEARTVREPAPGSLTFGEALDRLQDGCKLSRSGWNGKGMWIQLQRPDALSKMSLPYIYMKTADEKLVPWLASQTDVLASDWGVVG